VPSPKFLTPIWLAKVGAPFSMAVAKVQKKEPKYTIASLKTLQTNPRISNQKAVDELGFTPRSIEETIADSYQWFRERGRLRL
jgi:dihydroflavonol-4-reductase